MDLEKIIELPNFCDHRGCLVVMNLGQSIPFEVKRVYWIYNTKDQPRGFHAHKNLKQLAICVSGSCQFILDDGENKKEIKLNHPHQGLIIESMVWLEIHAFSDDCVLLVLASQLFSEDDYIRDYQEFLNATRDNKSL